MREGYIASRPAPGPSCTCQQLLPPHLSTGPPCPGRGGGTTWSLTLATPGVNPLLGRLRSSPPPPPASPLSCRAPSPGVPLLPGCSVARCTPQEGEGRRGRALAAAGGGGPKCGGSGGCLPGEGPEGVGGRSGAGAAPPARGVPPRRSCPAPQLPEGAAPCPGRLKEAGGGGRGGRAGSWGGTCL